jgi:putative addiction module component (TIGR02574 family)
VLHCIYQHWGDVLMSTFEKLGIDQMSFDERIALIREILDSLAAGQPLSPLSEAKRNELDRRIAEADANPAAGIPWEEIEAAALSRFGR